MKALLIGPYIGNFTYEITVFRPYAKYLSDLLDYDEVFISSHTNRSFLYDWIEPDNFLPIFEYLSRDESKLVGYTHNDISKLEYTQLSKRIVSQIPYDTLDIYSLPYSKTVSGIPFYEKEFMNFKYPEIDIPQNDYILLIPDKSKDISDIYNTLKRDYNVIVVGDMNNGLESENVLLKEPDYFTCNYIRMFNYIHKAKLVVTPCNYWAMICNIQDLPMFYWGSDSSMYKTEGVYGFGNRRAMAVNISNDKIPSQIKAMYEKVEKGQNVPYL